VKKTTLIIFVIIATVAFSSILLLLGKSPYPAIGIGLIALLLILILWEPPEKYKEFSDADRLEATLRAQGGSPPAKLPLPDMPPLKSHKKNRARSRKKK
jgi:plastocyanin domain-containing protein